MEKTIGVTGKPVNGTGAGISRDLPQNRKGRYFSTPGASYRNNRLLHPRGILFQTIDGKEVI